MRKTLAKLMISGVIVAISATSNSPVVLGQGFLKRLQDRVQSFDQENVGTQNPASGESSEAGTRAGAQRANQRRPLVDALLQYGPEIFGGQENSKPAPAGTPADQTRASGVATRARPSGQFQRAALGIDVLDSPPGVPGVLVTGFRSDSQADDAGLQKNDVIVSLDQTLTPKITDIARFLSVRRAGEYVTARVLRGDQMKTIRLPLLAPQRADLSARQPSAAPMLNSSIASPTVPRASVPRSSVPLAPVPRPPVQARGVTETLPIAGQVESLPPPTMRLSPSTDVQRYGILLGSGSRLRGALVDGVVNGSAADVAGIKPADRVVSVDGLLTQDNTAFVRQLSNLKQGTVASLGVVRGESFVIKGMKLTTELKSQDPALGQELHASKQQQSADGESMEAETGVLEGLGSVLGGLISGAGKGGAGKGGAGKGGAGKDNGKAQAEAMPKLPQEKLNPREPVLQTSFEQKVSGRLKKMVGDPPSLNGLSAKPKSETTPNVTYAEKPEQTAAEIREQIRQLQEKLKQLEQRSQLDDEPVQKNKPPTTKAE